MFHADPKHNTAVSLADTLNVEDDVIVTTAGNLSIGALPPAAADTIGLRLTDGGTFHAIRSPLRIEDGNQQEGHVLTSDASGNGYATWQPRPAGYEPPGRVYGAIGIPAGTFVRSQPNTFTIQSTGFTFTADVAGSYIFEVRWWSKYSQLVQANYIRFYLYRGAKEVDTFEQYAGSNSYDMNVFSACFALYSEAEKGDVFTLRLVPGFYNGSAGTTGALTTQTAPPWTQSRVNVLRIN
jgi:hypothetical protein